MGRLIAQVESERFWGVAVATVGVKASLLEPDGALDQPAVLSEGINEFLFQRGFGLELGEQVGEKGNVVGLALPALDFETVAAHAVRDGVLRGGRLAFGRFRAGGLGGVGLVCGELRLG